MEDVGCPRCKSTKYKNPALKLLVNVCGHSICERCVEMLFVRGVGNCEICHIPLRKNNFRIQMFESAEVERDVDIRRKILKDFNKQEKDFTTLREYNDYLEEVETIIFNLVYEVDVEATKMKLERYKQENQGVIKKNRSKISQEEAEIDKIIEEEEMAHKMWLNQLEMEEENKKVQKEKQKEDLMDDFMFSDLPVNKILKNHKEMEQQSKMITEKASKFSSGISIGKMDNIVPLSNINEVVEDSSYDPFDLESDGPEMPTEEEIRTLNYLTNVRNVSEKEAGCGFRSVLFCTRALGDAYNGLFISTDNKKF